MRLFRWLLASVRVTRREVSVSWLRENERREMTDLPIVAVWRTPKEIADMNRRARFDEFVARRAEQAERRRA